MGAALAPLHLLVLHHAFAHDLIHRRLDKTGRDPLTIAIAFSVVRDEFLIALHVGVQFLDALQKFPSRFVRRVERGPLPIKGMT